MVNINTSNGKYTITESLFKMIKENNPELLLEDDSYVISMLKNRGFDVNKIQNKNERQDLINKISNEMPSEGSQSNMKKYFDNVVDELTKSEDDLSELFRQNAIKRKQEHEKKLKNIKSQQEKNNEKKGTQEELFNDENLGNKPKKEIDDSKKDVILSQIRLHGKEIIDGFKNIENDYDFDSWINSKEGQYEINTAEKIHDSNENNEFNNNVDVNDKALLKKTSDKRNIELEDYLVSPYLINEIKLLESSSFKVVKRIKTLIHEYLGLYGDAIYAPVFDPEKILGTRWKSISNISDDENQYDLFGKTETLTDKAKKMMNNPYKILSQRNIREGVMNDSKILNEIDSFSSNAKLATGGFKITPYIKPGDESEDKIGTALKYYLSSMKSGKNSMVYDIMKEFLAIREYKNKNEGNADKENSAQKDIFSVSKYSDDEINKKIEDVAIGFLKTVVYKMEINNNKNFQRIIDVIRYDPTLNDIVSISNINAVRQFNTRETNLVFLSKVNNMPVVILNCVPLFAQGQEIFKNLKPIWGSLKQLKG